MGSYVPLWTKSNFSFLEGASHPWEMVQRAKELGLSALGLTDRDGLYGAVRAWKSAREHGVTLHLGAEVSVVHSVQFDPQELTCDPVVLIPIDVRGYANLCQLLSGGRARMPKGESRVTIREVCERQGGLIALTACTRWFSTLRDAFGDRLYGLCARHLTEEEVREESILRAAARFHDVPLVAAVEVLYHHKSRRAVADVLHCIRHGCGLYDAGTRIRSNAEHKLLSGEQFCALFSDDPAAVARTLEISERCSFHMGELCYRYPAEQVPDGMSGHDWLRALTMRGAHARYGQEVPEKVLAQIESELSLIESMDYGGYFLTMYEVVQYCREHNILCQGRGSAANSAVCYCLGITAIDPIRMGLLFERFLSRERAEPPDIDLDIEHQRREEVIQHVYDKYGRRNAAMVANLNRYRPKSAVRDVGKVLGIPVADVDGIAKLLTHFSTGIDSGLIQRAGLDRDAPSMRHLLSLATEILGFPRHLSIHPGGFVLGDRPVDTLVPIEPATMPGRTVIQWDKDDVEDLGLFKLDLLGLGALTAVHRCFELLKRHKNVDMDLSTVPAEDPDTYRMVSKGDTVGVFQIESRAQMSMLPRLQPRCFYDLVIEVAIMRPGPIQGDMVHPYLRRRRGQEPVEYPHPCLEPVLGKTLGVPIFQEQVMRLAMEAADYTAGEADQLRRDMAAWRMKGCIEKHYDRIVPRMVNRGIDRDFAERVFSQIEGFGEYGFPESHAASFALIAYCTSWMKCRHPEVFLCAMLNAQPMGFYSPSTLIEDAKRHGVKVLPVQVNQSAWDCDLERIDRGWAVRMGLRYIKGLGEVERQRLERLPRSFTSLEQFARMARFSWKVLKRLAESGALDGFGLPRREVFWKLRALHQDQRDTVTLGMHPSKARFEALTGFEEIVWDHQTSHHSTRGHPMASLREALQRMGVPDAQSVWMSNDNRWVEYVGMVICRQRPHTAKGVVFMTLEDETGFVNVILWPSVFEKYMPIGKTAPLLGVKGRLQFKDGVQHIVAKQLWVPDVGDGSVVVVPSRSFH